MTVRRPRASFATVTSLLAISIALGGTAYATSSLPRGSVGTAQLQKGAVTSGKVKNGTLKAVDFARKQILQGARGPVGPIGPAGVVDSSQFYTKAQADARFLHGSFTVVASAIVTNGSFGSATATCPAGSQVVGGGVEPNNVLTMSLSASYPLVDGTALISLTDGQHGPATAWRAFVDNTSGADAPIKVMAVCAPIG
jgi:hypothetical protein